jgi:hypothetical protein
MRLCASFHCSAFCHSGNRRGRGTREYSGEMRSRGKGLLEIMKESPAPEVQPAPARKGSVRESGHVFQQTELLA